MNYSISDHIERAIKIAYVKILEEQIREKLCIQTPDGILSHSVSSES